MRNGVLTILVAVAVSFGLVTTVGCESEAQTGALIGTAIGAAAGQAIGGDTEATLIGAGVGAAGGYMIGGEQEKQQMKADIAAAQQAANTVTVNITNSNGSITPVVLRRQGNLWVGPKGEQYMSLPTPEDLKPVYGF